ncbi:hypothetical protein U8C31_18270 [Sinorhizobium medicae]|uniref:hypothetical protein n=1 Tax=Sinorhizobium medicae TaxID=110321 RepID=UPI002AF6B2F9|nr:hypothetical protein [Sinorhizobium medicae]WQO72183.1 hypothetical protein U8C31_18270 [Sinorhizobium medicae]
MKEAQDHEMRMLITMERLAKWHRDGGIQRSIAKYRTQIAEAEVKLAQIEVLKVASERLSTKESFVELCNRQMCQIAEQHRAEAAERPAIQEAMDEFLVLEQMVPADDIDDILSDVSAALRIELPDAELSRPDICQREYTSIEDLKRFLGPSLATGIINPVQAVQEVLTEHQQAEELIADVRRTAILQGMVDDSTSDEYFAAGAVRQAAEDKLSVFVGDLINRSHFPRHSPDWVEPKRELITPTQTAIDYDT